MEQRVQPFHSVLENDEYQNLGSPIKTSNNNQHISIHRANNLANTGGSKYKTDYESAPPINNVNGRNLHTLESSAAHFNMNFLEEDTNHIIPPVRSFHESGK
jgi:hypothetical protein